eukprot:CAMPEP_0114353778 /NCGR_PEP_ID=MMETSP0101-20121206/18926_1 /TAXON_ID=38822 ORGANISM="Pteridomonas danica, Strain PT" /NCGR_SAMPLE_ID=MMETSP0101 /ASSEMBLY_ACC=CAM_ASM_000211 /LENGTH=45 /DNA_ID= /DNA_START= /DNA_END= /DNA_ORIENTATION=
MGDDGFDIEALDEFRDGEFCDGDNGGEEGKKVGFGKNAAAADDDD